MFQARAKLLIWIKKLRIKIKSFLYIDINIRIGGGNGKRDVNAKRTTYIKNMIKYKTGNLKQIK